MIVSILPGGGPGSAWRHPRKPVALAIRLSIFAVGGLTAYAVSQKLQCLATISRTCISLIDCMQATVIRFHMQSYLCCFTSSDLCLM